MPTNVTSLIRLVLKLCKTIYSSCLRLARAVKSGSSVVVMPEFRLIPLVHQDGLRGISDPRSLSQRLIPSDHPTHQPITQTSSIMNTTISFTPEGTAHCLWTEALPLHELGKLQVTRASRIEFNNTTQQWEVKDRRGHIRFFSRSRSACLEWEQRNLQPD